MVRALSILTLLAVGGCVQRGAFVCNEASDCTLEGQQGFCAEEGSCAYPSDDCLSGYAYSPNAAGGLAGECTEQGATSTGTTTGETTGVSTLTEAASSTTSITGDSDSSAGPDPVCGNRVVDTAEECDDGNEDEEDGCDRSCNAHGTIEWLLVDDASDSAWNSVVVQESPAGTPFAYVAGHRDGVAQVTLFDGRSAEPYRALDGNEAWGISERAGDVYVAIDTDGSGTPAAVRLRGAVPKEYSATKEAGSQGRDALRRSDEVFLASRGGITVFEEDGDADPSAPYDTPTLRRLVALAAGGATLYAAGAHEDTVRAQSPALYAFLPGESPLLCELWRLAEKDREGLLQAVVVDNDRLYVGGHTGAADSRRGLLVRLDLDGTVVWEQHFLQESEVESIVVLGGIVYAVGVTVPGSRVASMWAYDVDGNPLWARRFPEFGDNSSFIRDIAVLDDELFIVVGETNFGDSGNAFVAHIRP